MGSTCSAEAPIFDCYYYFVKQDEAIELANKIIKYNEKLPEDDKLLYESPGDLLETCNLAIANENDIFDRYHLSSIWIKESKLYRKAHNKRDGGKGIAQVMRKYWKEELPWYTNPYDKRQSTTASAYVLNILHAKHKTVASAIKHYNGSQRAADKYKEAVLKIRRDLKAA